MLGDSISEQNALIISALLMDRGAVNVPVSLVPTLLNVGTPVVTSGMPPFDWWQPPPPGPGGIPIYRTDAGAFLIAETFGAQTVIYVKDQDGLYTAHPATTPDAAQVPEIAASQLLARGLPDLPLEPVVVEMLAEVRTVRRVQLINGLGERMIARTVAGEPVGSTITAGEASKRAACRLPRSAHLCQAPADLAGKRRGLAHLGDLAQARVVVGHHQPHEHLPAGDLGLAWSPADCPLCDG